ncbi:hypothetical protein CVT26_002528 [Gymnopilus dilepis]|uniref:Uncharacterized protein n=1 Tax=Gymnopilus dilepis TaxID=231916 RepID=A0A409VT12_9AGAR|nr:hypothetical protein CVT26_002528 [Gymnopilus dilepis]
MKFASLNVFVAVVALVSQATASPAPQLSPSPYKCSGPADAHLALLATDAVVLSSMGWGVAMLEKLVSALWWLDTDFH